MNKVLVSIATLFLSTNSVAQDSDTLQALCEMFNSTVPRLVELYEENKFPPEIKRSLNEAYVENYPNLDKDSLSILITMSNNTVDYVFIRYNEGYPSKLIQKDISENICSKF